MRTIKDPDDLTRMSISNNEEVQALIFENGHAEILSYNMIDLIEDQVPHKVYNYGLIALSSDKILMFGGINEQQG